MAVQNTENRSRCFRCVDEKNKSQECNRRLSFYRNKTTGNIVGKDYNYKFQEQELQETGFYAFKWRNYDPSMGRFFNVDPLSEKYAYQSHYNFSENRLTDGREIEGLEYIDIDDMNWDSSRSWLYNVAHGNFEISVGWNREGSNDSGNSSNKQIELGEITSTFVADTYNNLNEGFDSGIMDFTKDTYNFVTENAYSSDYWLNKGAETLDAAMFIQDMSTTRPDGSTNSMDIYNNVRNASAYDVGYFIGYNGAQITTTAVLTEGGGALLNGVKSINPFGARGGYGLFGKNGLKINGYKLESMYGDGNGGGTILSIKQMKKEGASIRLDYGKHNSSENYFHIHSRFYLGDTKIGSTKPWPNKK